MATALSSRITPARRRALLSSETSRQNKLWLATAWQQCDGIFIEWRWRGEYMNSRLCFRFGPDEAFVDAKSYDEDVVPTLKFGKEKKDKAKT